MQKVFTVNKATVMKIEFGFMLSIICPHIPGRYGSDCPIKRWH